MTIFMAVIIIVIIATPSLSFYYFRYDYKAPVTVYNQDQNYTWRGDFMAASSVSPLMLGNITSNSIIVEKGYLNSTISYRICGWGCYIPGAGNTTLLNLRIFIHGNLTFNLRPTQVKISQNTSETPSVPPCTTGGAFFGSNTNATYPSSHYNPYAFSDVGNIVNESKLSHGERFHFTYDELLRIRTSDALGGGPITAGETYDFIINANIAGLSEPVETTLNLAVVGEN